MSPDLQSAFAAAVRTGDAAAIGAVCAAALSPERARAALHIHASTTRQTLTQALRETFPNAARAMTHDAFDAVAADYVRNAPPRRAALWFWGDDFPDALAAASATPLAIDLARLDLAWLLSFAAAEAAPLDGRTLAAVAPDDLARVRLQPHPSARWLAVAPGALDAWRGHGALPDHPLDDLGAGGVVFARPEAQVRSLAVGPGSLAFLDALADGTALLDSLDAAVAAEPDFDLSAALAPLFAIGAFARLTTERTGP